MYQLSAAVFMDPCITPSGWDLAVWSELCVAANTNVAIVLGVISSILRHRWISVENLIEKIAPVANMSDATATGNRKRTWSASNREEGERSQDRRGSGSGGGGGQRLYDGRNSGNTSHGGSSSGSGHNKASIRSTAWKTGGNSGGGGGFGGGYGSYENAGKRGRGGSRGGGGFGGHAGRGGYHQY
jgi:hypothetical protein